MVTRWGMSDALGPATLAPRDSGLLGSPDPFGFGAGAKLNSEATAQIIDAEVRRILQECYQQAERLLSEHRTELDALAHALLEQETLDEQQILNVTGLPSAPRLAGAPLSVLTGDIDSSTAA
jgi:cell division protease FtsH